jgi:hypothetical protein
MSNLPDPNSFSYHRGFIDGFKTGVEDNPYDGSHPENAKHHRQYRWGYDAGVATYCRENLDKE